MNDVVDARPLIEVACGVVLNPAGEALMAQRPAGKIAAGYWEFPGGKIEAGESAHDALVRELDEELGIRVHASTPLIDFIQPYTDRRVRLATAWVRVYTGTPSGREGQALAWARPERLLELTPHLPSVAPILDALCWPAAYAITPAVATGTPPPRPSNLPVGSLIRLRQPQWSDLAYAEAASHWVARQRAEGFQPVLDRDPSHAAALGAMFHASEACWRRQARGADWPRRCLASVHDAAGIRSAREWGRTRWCWGRWPAARRTPSVSRWVGPHGQRWPAALAFGLMPSADWSPVHWQWRRRMGPTASRQSVAGTGTEARCGSPSGCRVEGVAGQRFDDLVTLLEPVAEVDQLAALTTKRAPRVLWIETAGRAAMRAAAEPGHGWGVAHRVQHCIMNGTSTLSCWARSCTEATVMKRMLKR